MSSRVFALLLSGTAFVATSLPAFAIEPKSVADALAAALAGGSKAKVAYDEVVQDGVNVVIHGLRVIHLSKAAGGEGEPPAGAASDGGAGDTLTFADAVIENPADSPTAIFTAPRVTFSNGTISGGSTGAIAAAEMTDVTVLDPAAIKGGEPGKGLIFQTAEARDLSFRPEGKAGVFTVAKVFLESGNVVDNVPQQSKGSIEAITIPDEAFAGSQFTPQTIGYDKLVLNITWDGQRDPAADTLAIRDLTVGVKDGGDLTFSGIMGKLPQPSTMDDADAGAKATATELHTATIRYQDSSLAGRVLDYLAKQQGIARADYANQIAAALPFLLAAVNNPEFQNQLAGALGSFLKDPKSLTIKFEPSGPISGDEIISIARTAPQTLPDRLHVSVTANGAN